jgi:hypothetical protein
MSTSLPEAIEHHEEAASSLREILLKYPDATFTDRNAIQASSLAAADCDFLALTHDAQGKTMVRAGRVVAGSAVLHTHWAQHLTLVVAALQDKRPELYRELVQFVARGGK